VPHQEIDCKFEYFSKFEFIFETALGYESVGWGTCFNEKTKGKISCVSVPLKFITKNKNDEIKKILNIVLDVITFVLFLCCNL
jgi:hypothetical protein